MSRLAIALLLAAGCSPHVSPATDAGLAGPADARSVPSGADSSPPVERGFVYAHTNRRLYRVDPNSLVVTEVGRIAFSDGINQLTDLAIDRQGRMIGISFRQIYVIDPDTAEATYLAELDSPFNGLSFIPVGDDEVLVGTAADGNVLRIDPMTGETQPIGNFGNGIGSSGDVVGVFQLGTLATAIRDDWASDHLVRIDPNTGEATDVADTGVAHIWGLGFWQNRLFGFAESGEFVVIDATTGETELVEQTGIEWWGAAVTTAAPVIL